MADSVYFDGVPTPARVVRRRLREAGVSRKWRDLFLATAEFVWADDGVIGGKGPNAGEPRQRDTKTRKTRVKPVSQREKQEGEEGVGTKTKAGGRLTARDRDVLVKIIGSPIGTASLSKKVAQPLIDAGLISKVRAVFSPSAPTKYVCEITQAGRDAVSQAGPAKANRMSDMTQGAARKLQQAGKLIVTTHSNSESISPSHAAALVRHGVAERGYSNGYKVVIWKGEPGPTDVGREAVAEKTVAAEPVAAPAQPPAPPAKTSWRDGDDPYVNAGVGTAITQMEGAWVEGNHYLRTEGGWSRLHDVGAYLGQYHGRRGNAIDVDDLRKVTPRNSGQFLQPVGADGLVTHPVHLEAFDVGAKLSHAKYPGEYEKQADGRWKHSASGKSFVPSDFSKMMQVEPGVVVTPSGGPAPSSQTPTAHDDPVVATWPPKDQRDYEAVIRSLHTPSARINKIPMSQYGGQGGHELVKHHPDMGMEVHYRHVPSHFVTRLEQTGYIDHAGKPTAKAMAGDPMA